MSSNNTLPITLWTTGRIVLTIGDLDDNMILHIKQTMLPQLNARPMVYNTAMHQAREFIKVFNTNADNKIFQSDGTTEIKDNEKKAKQIARWVTHYNRMEEKKAAKRKAESDVKSQKKVHLTDDTSLSPPVSVVSNNTAAASNFTNNNNFNSLATGGGMDTGGLQSKKVQHRDNKFSAPTTGMHLSSHLLHPVPSVVSNTTAASNNFTAGTELSISLPPDEDNGMSEMVHHQQYQQRESPTSATADLVAAAAVSTAPGFSPPSDKQNHQPQSNPPQFQQPPSPHKSVHSVDGMDGFLEALDNDRNMDNIVQEMSAMRLDLQEMKEMKVEFGEMKVEFVEMKAKVGELEAKMEENSKLLEYFCSKDKKEE